MRAVRVHVGVTFAVTTGMAHHTTWIEMLTVMKDADIRDRGMAAASSPDPVGPPVVPPDDPSAARVGSDPSIEPPSTVPEQVAPAGDPRQPPVTGWTARMALG